MAVVGFAEEMAKCRSYDHDQFTNRRRYFRRFRVLVDSPHDDSLMALSAPGLPGRGQSYQTNGYNDASARVVRYGVTEDTKTRLLWYIDVEYDTQKPPDVNPLDDPPEIDIDFETFEKAHPGRFIQEDSLPNGEPGARVYRALTNSAGEPFEPAKTYRASRPIVTIVRNEEFFSMLTTTKYQDAVNTDLFAQHQPRQVLMRGIKARRMYAAGDNNDSPSLRYWSVTYVLVFDREGHDLQMPDVGHYYYKLNEAEEKVGSPIPFGTQDGQPILGYLNGKGGKLSSSATEPYYLVFDDMQKQASFAELNLPQDFNVEAAAREGQRRTKGTD